MCATAVVETMLRGAGYASVIAGDLTVETDWSLHHLSFERRVDSPERELVREAIAISP